MGSKSIKNVINGPQNVHDEQGRKRRTTNNRGSRYCKGTLTVTNNTAAAVLLGTSILHVTVDIKN